MLCHISWQPHFGKHSSGFSSTCLSATEQGSCHLLCLELIAWLIVFIPVLPHDGALTSQLLLGPCWWWVVQAATFQPHINQHSLEIMQERRGSSHAARFLNRLEADIHGRKMRLQVWRLPFSCAVCLSEVFCSTCAKCS